MQVAFPQDSRFNYLNYGKQPRWLVRQALQAGCQKRNLEQYSLARALQVYTDVHRDPNAGRRSPFEDFLPHPVQWKQYSSNREIRVSAKTARIILQRYEKYGQDCVMAFEPYLTDLMACL